MLGAGGLSTTATQFLSSGALAAVHRPSLSVCLTLTDAERGYLTLLSLGKPSSLFYSNLRDNSILLIVHPRGNLGVYFYKYECTLQQKSLKIEAH